MTTPDVQWLVKAPGLPDVVIPVEDERAAKELINTLRRTVASYRSRLAFEYGLHFPGVPNSYRRMGP